MGYLGWTVTGVAAVLAVSAGAGAWVMFKRPRWMWTQLARKALKSAHLAQVTIPSLVGPQTAFVGGTGPLVILLHGAGDQAGTWAKVAPALLPDHTVVIPDLAGHGASAPATGPIQASAIVAGLEAVLERHCQGRKATLVGNSLGGWMAFVLANRHPEWVEKIVAVNGGPLPSTGIQVNLLPTTREAARETMAQLRDPSSPAVPDFVLDDMVRQYAISPLARFASTAPTLGPWLMDDAQLSTIQASVDMVWGTSDAFYPMAYAEHMQSLLPGSRIFPVERSGHIPQAEAPARFQEALLTSLKS